MSSATISGQPTAWQREAATRDAIDCRGEVMTGRPAHSTSVPVVWPLHVGVSRKASASEARAMYAALSVTSDQKMRSGARPSAAAAAVMCGTARAGKRRSHSTELGTSRSTAAQLRNVGGSSL